MRKIVKKFPKDYRIVMSIAEPNSPEKLVRDGNVSIYPWIHNRFEFLKACDVVVARAGLGTIGEALCYGKPLVLIPTPSHTEQFNNAKRTEKQLSAAIRDVLTDPYSRRAEAVQMEVSKYDAVKTMVDVISKYNSP
jgi:uncharacterized protein (TIGR00661 family)